jgi:hypothetical protein
MAAVDPVPELVDRARVSSDELARGLVELDSAVAAALAEALERHLSSDPLRRLERVWQVSASQVAAMVGVSRQAYAKWHAHGVPGERRADVADLDAANAELLARVRIDRIPAAVRRPAPALGGRCLLDVGVSDGPAAVRAAVEHAFDLGRVQP